MGFHVIDGQELDIGITLSNMYVTLSGKITNVSKFMDGDIQKWRLESRMYCYTSKGVKMPVMSSTLQVVVEDHEGSPPSDLFTPLYEECKSKFSGLECVDDL